MSARCVRCGEPAEFDSPQDLCERCWQWWFNDAPLSHDGSREAFERDRPHFDEKHRETT